MVFDQPHSGGVIFWATEKLPAGAYRSAGEYLIGTSLDAAGFGGDTGQFAAWKRHAVIAGELQVRNTVVQ